MQHNQDSNQNEQKEDTDTADEGIGVGASKQSKIIVIIAVTIFISGVIYFLFIKSPGEPNKEVNTDELIIQPSAGTGPIREQGVDYNTTDILDIPNTDFNIPRIQDNIPQVPEVPTLSDDLRSQIAASLKQPETGGKTYTEDELNKILQDKVKEELEKQINVLSTQQPIQTPQQQITPGVQITTPKQSNEMNLNDLYNLDNKPKQKIGSDTDLSEGELIVNQQKKEAQDLAKAQKSRALQERKAAPMFKMSGGSGPSSSLPQDSDSIILSYTNAKLDIQSKTPDVLPTQISDLTRVILQGKIISAVLETAIDTDLPSTVRAVITRDVYAEEGKNILIPRGSRVVGTYGTDVATGQTRVTINWNRIIRVDGMSLNIASIGSDRLGRAGIQGELDNRYAQQLANSFLSSVLSVGTAIVGEKVSGSTGITNTISSLTGETTQTSGRASDYALIDATQQFMDDAKEIVDDISEQKPVIRIPQGEKVTIMVTQDVSLPIFKRGS